MALSDENNLSLKIAHLNMIQGVIGRMSGFSAGAKTFTVTIFAGLSAISLQSDKSLLGIIAIMATIFLSALDVYYMTLELRFRALYDHVAARNLNQADDLAIRPLARTGDVRRALNSTSTRLFYLPIFAACICFICYGFAYEWKAAANQFPGRAVSRVERPVDATTNTIERTKQLSTPDSRKSTATAGH